MSKTRKTTGTDNATDTSSMRAAGEEAERLAKGISDSAQQIWLAGLGAFARAQAEGTRLFEGLVKDGMGLEQEARKLTENQTDAMREAVENRVAQAREQANHAWERMESAFETRVQRTLARLGMPGRDDIAALSRRIDALTEELRSQHGNRGTARKGATKKTAPRKSAAKKATGRKASKSTARKTATTSRRPRKKT